VIGITVLGLALLALRGTVPRVAAASAGAVLVLATSGVAVLQRAALATLWTGSTNVTDNALDNLLTPGAAGRFLALLAGTAWNPLAATLGLVVPGLAVLAATGWGLLRRLSVPGESTARAAACVATLLGILGTWALAAAFFVGTTRADALVYGRYVETVAALPLAAGLAAVVRMPVRRAALVMALSTGLVGLLAAVTWRTSGEAIANNVVFPFNTSGVLLLGLDATRPQLLIATSLATVGAAGVVMALVLRRAAAAVLVLAVFLGGVGFVADRLLLPIDRSRYAGWSPPAVPQEAGVVAITDDPQFWFPHVAYQFWVPRAQVRHVDLETVDRPSQRYVIAPPAWPGASRPGTRELWRDRDGVLALYEQGVAADR
jgi:hypothetical protein